MTRTCLTLSVTLALAGLLAPTHAAKAATEDFKFVAAADCVPFAPDTTSAELQYLTAGIYNPGTTFERVLCPLPRDQEDGYQANELEVDVYYRTFGATGGRVVCTLYVGSTSMQTKAIYTTTVAGPVVANGNRASLTLHASSQTDEFWTVPVSMLCSLDPKTSLAGANFAEYGPTHLQ
jgi:hypothetical protein